MSEQEYAIGYVTFYRMNGHWHMSVFNDPPPYENFWRIKVPVPRRLWAGEGKVPAKIEEVDQIGEPVEAPDE